MWYNMIIIRGGLMIKLIVSDLDGTLLKYDNEFDYESYQKIKELEKKGVDVCNWERLLDGRGYLSKV